MDATQLQAYLGVPMPSIEIFEKPEDRDKSRTVLYEAIDDLCACSKQLEFYAGTGFVNPEIKLMDKQSRDAIVERSVFPKEYLERCEILVVSSNVPFSLYDEIIGSQNERSAKRDVPRLLARVEFCKRISDLLVMANIARVGSIELLHSVVVQDNEKMDSNEIPEMDGYALQRATEAADRMGWPQLHVLEIQNVWNWATNHRQMLEGFDGTQLGRAINAFSLLFDRKIADEPMQLLWALVGLEALYVTGKTELLQQVREKSQMLLGQQEAYKKKISEMYNLRSRFVHGDLDFPGICLIADAREAVEKYDKELYDAIAVAVAVLAATIQEIIRRNWNGVQFRYTLADVCKYATYRDRDAHH